MNTRSTESASDSPAPTTPHAFRKSRYRPLIPLQSKPSPGYAWVILGVAMMGMFMSGPGQSYSVAAFIDPMLRDLGLLRSQYSLAYLVATLISGASLPFVGRALDALGARRMLPAIALLLGLACLWMSSVRHLLGLYLGLTMVRCLGQGALTLISTWMVGQWFFTRRGLAMGLLGLGSTFSFMIFPSNNLWLIEHHGWRNAWSVLAVSVWAILCIPAIFLVRNRPEHLDQESEPLTSNPKEDPSPTHDRSETPYFWTARQASRTAAFWKVVSALATSAMVSTGLVFHQVSILSGWGVSKEAALGLLGVQALFACIMSLVGGYLADRMPARYLLSVSMVLIATAVILLLIVKSSLVALPYSVLLGMHMGIQRSSGSLTIIEFFGRIHFGSINGLAMSLVVGAAALGPLPLALAKDYLGSYEPALLALLCFPLASAIAVWSAHPPGNPSRSAP